jgi:hypothetical protein
MKLCGLSWDDQLDLRVRLARMSLAPEEAMVGVAYELTFLDVVAMSATGDVLYGIVERVLVSGDLDANPLASSRIAACSPTERAALRLFELHTDEPEPALGRTGLFGSRSAGPRLLSLSASDRS